MNDEDLIAVLEDAGLSPYQAEAYVALLELGNATATDVADACDVPDPRIYDVLRDLEAKGYVETYQQDSLTARAHDPEYVLEHLRTRSSRLLDAADEIEDRWSRPAVTDHEVSIVKRFETVLERATSLIAEAESQVQVGVDVAQFRALRDELAVAHERGVTVEVSIYADDDAGDLPDESAFDGVCAETRYRPIPAPFVVVVDRTWTCFVPHQDTADEYGVLVSDRAYSYVFHWFFLTCLWDAWETVYAARPGETPDRYVDVRQCVRDLASLRRDGATVEVAVEGRDTATDDPVDVEGRVVGLNYADAARDDEGDLSLAELAGCVGFTVDTGEQTVEVGGWGATVEDVEASTITVTDVTGD